ncbi:hypothetical protein [Flavobacterium sp. HSC-61S13]|uniref:hypothetical protein n=1 Tax=Flavobacterium sp. HSC-61S13 TaxID=2910963 RepID=UPI0020A1C41A|nr:hypothetical protein [Flavobacterium sp. HSC-61S13]MCP1995051.1 hypothetical protein [Flavobacterium sp. HSC-61S13]
MRILILTLLMLCVSCKKEKKNTDLFDKYKGIQLTETRSESLENNIKYSLEFPDTLKVNQAYDAVFEFESDFDTIVAPMVVDSIKFRTITLYYYNPVRIGVRNKESDLVLRDSILIPNKKFTLGNVKFTEKGKYLFLALIEDEIMYNFYNAEGIRDSVHFNRKIQEVKKEVVVIE